MNALILYNNSQKKIETKCLEQFILNECNAILRNLLVTFLK